MDRKYIIVAAVVKSNVADYQVEVLQMDENNKIIYAVINSRRLTRTWIVI